MKRTFKICVCFVLLLATVITFTGCGSELAELKISGDTYVYSPNINLLVMPMQTASSTQTTESSETLKPPESEPEITSVTVTDDDGINKTVYWTPTGEVWHLKMNCSSLSHSKNVIAGTVDEAMTAGKERACKRCGG